MGGGLVRWVGRFFVEIINKLAVGSGQLAVGSWQKKRWIGYATF